MRASAVCSGAMSSSCKGINPTMGALTKNRSAGNLDPALASLQNWGRDVLLQPSSLGILLACED